MSLSGCCSIPSFLRRITVAVVKRRHSESEHAGFPTPEVAQTPAMQLYFHLPEQKFLCKRMRAQGESDLPRQTL